VQPTAVPAPPATWEEPPADGVDDLKPHTGDLHEQSRLCNMPGQTGGAPEDGVTTHSQPSTGCRCTLLRLPNLHPTPLQPDTLSLAPGSEELKFLAPVEKFNGTTLLSSSKPDPSL